MPSPMGARPNQKRPILRIARTLFLILLVFLLLPYVLTPLYRAGHPVSTLMLWRKLSGAPMSRGRRRKARRLSLGHSALRRL